MLKINFKNEKNIFWIIFSICSVLALWPIWSVKYLPMYDLPEHAAQVSILKNMSNPLFGFEGKYVLDWGTPYFVGILLTRIFAAIFELITSFKIVLSLVVLGFPLSIYFLIRQTKGDPHWCFIGFPMAFGLNFIFGHYSFLFATPLGIAFIALALKVSSHPTKLNQWLLVLFSVLLFFSHVVVFLFCVAVMSPILVFRRNESISVDSFRMWPSALAIFSLPILWWLFYPSTPGQFKIPIGWYPERLGQFQRLLLGIPGDALAAKFAVGFLGILLFGARLSKRPLYWLPFFIAIGIYLTSPHHFFGVTKFIYHRSALFLIPCLILLLRPAASMIRSVVSRLAMVGLTLVWLTVILWRFTGFNLEAKEIDPILDRMPMNRRVYSLIFNPNSDFISTKIYPCFGTWYQAFKGGELGYSYAMHRPQWVRLKPEFSPRSLAMTQGLFFSPFRFKPRHAKNYDYLLVRSKESLINIPSLVSNPYFHLLGRNGNWWLYGNNNSKPSNERERFPESELILNETSQDRPAVLENLPSE